MKLKKILSVLLACAFLFLCVACDNEPNTVYIAIKNYGIVTVELYEDDAPITVANFKKLVREGFYDGLTFHRIIESFMIQGGCPKGDGTGDAGKDIKGEFSANGVDTGIKHVEGTISMARSGHDLEGYLKYGGFEYNGIWYPFSEEDIEYIESFYNTASSQFFIVTETSENNTKALDGRYAAFGQVTDGMEIVKAIAAVDTNADDKPLTPVVIATITFDKAAAEAALAK